MGATNRPTMMSLGAKRAKRGGLPDQFEPSEDLHPVLSAVLITSKLVGEVGHEFCVAFSCASISSNSSAISLVTADCRWHEIVSATSFFPGT